MTTELKPAPCPWCKRDNATIIHFLDWCKGNYAMTIHFRDSHARGYLDYVRCDRMSCSAHGPIRKTERGAIKAWNKVAEAINGKS